MTNNHWSIMLMISSDLQTRSWPVHSSSQKQKYKIKINITKILPRCLPTPSTPNIFRLDFLPQLRLFCLSISGSRMSFRLFSDCFQIVIKTSWQDILAMSLKPTVNCLSCQVHRVVLKQMRNYQRDSDSDSLKSSREWGSSF